MNLCIYSKAYGVLSWDTLYTYTFINIYTDNIIPCCSRPLHRNDTTIIGLNGVNLITYTHTHARTHKVKRHTNNIFSILSKQSKRRNTTFIYLMIKIFGYCKYLFKLAEICIYPLITYRQ